MEPRPTQVACEGQQGVAELLWSDLSPPEDRGAPGKVTFGVPKLASKVSDRKGFHSVRLVCSPASSCVILGLLRAPSSLLRIDVHARISR